MSKKYKQKHAIPKTGGQKDVAARDEAVTKKSRFTKGVWVIILATVTVVGCFVGWFLYTAVKTEQKKARKSTEQTWPFPKEKRQEVLEDVVFEDFVGSEVCGSCHADQFEKWERSTHGHAGGDPTSDVIFAHFDGKERKFRDAVLTPYKTANADYMFQLKTLGQPDQTYKVEAVVGGGRMIGGGTQTFFTSFPDGTLRMLPFDFIRDEKTWFGETSKGKGWLPINEGREIDKTSEWTPTRVMGSHLSRQNCQECHGSQIQMNFDVEAKKYVTRYKSLTINCESCHGPGKKHVGLMASTRRDTLVDIGLTSLKTLTKDESLEVCFRCHSLKNVLKQGFLPGMDLENYYAMKLQILTRKPYFDDGRIREFGYQLNHLASDCYISGSMTCVDCHAPHSLEYRDINDQPLDNPFDDRQCTDCHPSKARNPIAHSFHKEGSPGNKCVSCHMPYLQHPAIGNQLRFSRSDHTIAIPRPALDASLGLKSACKQCHEDKSVEFLQAKTEEWYGEIKPHNPTVAKLMQFEEGMDRQRAGELLLDTASGHVLGQMTGLSTFALQYLSSDMEKLEPQIVARIKGFVENPDLDVKSFAMASLHLAQGNQRDIHDYLVEKLGDLSTEEDTKVRARWAVILPFMARKYESEGNYQAAIQAYVKALEIQPENTLNLLSLGIAQASVNQFEQAIKTYDRVIALDKYQADAWLNKGNAYHGMGNEKIAVDCYKKSIDINPWNSSPYFNIGNILFNNRNYPLAIQYYEKVVELEPTLPLSYFYLARSLVETEAYDRALEWVQRGLRIDPSDEKGRQMELGLINYLSTKGN
ncbi:MAG: tetratricopeptide repeat protein [Cyclobacteriaceae bacterium]|nr:tetratricopeptide repeat protein [Cyclobacteriaceae bacterium]